MTDSGGGVHLQKERPSRVKTAEKIIFVYTRDKNEIITTKRNERNRMDAA